MQNNHHDFAAATCGRRFGAFCAAQLLCIVILAGTSVNAQTNADCPVALTDGTATCAETPAILMQHAKELRENGERVEAWTKYSAALAIDPFYQPALEARAWGLLGLLRTAESAPRTLIAIADAGLERNPADDLLLQSRARAHEKMGNIAAAIQDYEDAVRHSRPPHSVRTLLIELLISIGNLDSAEVQLQALTDDIDPNGTVISGIRHQLAAYLLVDHPPAVQVLDARRLALLGIKWSAMDLYGQLYLARADYAQAARIYDELVAWRPQSTGYRLHRAAAHEGLGDIDGALEELSTVLAENAESNTLRTSQLIVILSDRMALAQIRSDRPMVYADFDQMFTLANSDYVAVLQKRLNEAPGFETVAVSGVYDDATKAALRACILDRGCPD